MDLGAGAPPPPRALLKVVGDWKLLAPLGRGTFGEVVYAQDFTHREAAVKVWAREGGRANRVKYRLIKREIAMMKKLEHPHVLKLYEVLETPRHFYLVLEFAGGGELFSRIEENKRFRDPVARRYFQQLVAAVKYCHSQGIVHRNLKPENLLLTSSDTLKLADFGYSNFQTAEDATGAVTRPHLLKTQCGTPNYAAPEVFLNDGYDGFCTDVWSCGVILYHMVCGYVPFRAREGSQQPVQGVIDSILAGRYTIPRAVSPGAAGLIFGILHTEPAARFTVQQIMHNAWFQEGCGGATLQWSKIPQIVVTDECVNRAVQDAVEGEVEYCAASHRAFSGAAGDASEPQAQAPTLQSAESTTTMWPRESSLPSSPGELGTQGDLDYALDVDDVEGVTPHAHIDPAPTPSCSTPVAGDVSFAFMNRTVSVGNSTAVADGTPPLHPMYPECPTPVADMAPPPGDASGSFHLLVEGDGSADPPPSSELRLSPTDGRAPPPRLNAPPAPSVAPLARPLPLPYGSRKKDRAPVEAGTEHCFERKHWNTPQSCFVCKKLILGIGKQGFSCVHCQMPVHIKCVDVADSRLCAEYVAAGSPRWRLRRNTIRKPP